MCGLAIASLRLTTRVWWLCHTIRLSSCYPHLWARYAISTLILFHIKQKLKTFNSLTDFDENHAHVHVSFANRPGDANLYLIKVLHKYAHAPPSTHKHTHTQTLRKFVCLLFIQSPSIPGLNYTNGGLSFRQAKYTQTNETF